MIRWEIWEKRIEAISDICSFLENMQTAVVGFTQSSFDVMLCPFANTSLEMCGFYIKSGFSEAIPPKQNVKLDLEHNLNYITLHGINISHIGKRKIIFKSALVGDT